MCWRVRSDGIVTGADLQSQVGSGLDVVEVAVEVVVAAVDAEV